MGLLFIPVFVNTENKANKINACGKYIINSEIVLHLKNNVALYLQNLIPVEA
jgi:hypothetical protein